LFVLFQQFEKVPGTRFPVKLAEEFIDRLPAQAEAIGDLFRGLSFPPQFDHAAFTGTHETVGAFCFQDLLPPEEMQHRLRHMAVEVDVALQHVATSPVEVFAVGSFG